MSNYVPTMRPDVVFDEEGDAATLRCPRTGHQLPIEQGWERRLIRAADGTRSVDALIAAAVKGPGVTEGADDGSRPSDPRQALHFVKTLRYLRLLADTDETMLQAIERARSEPGRIAEAAPFRTLPGAKFGCHMCGGCCRNQRLGPIQDEDVQRLEALPDLEERFPLVRTSGRAKKNPDGEWFLPQRSDSRCAYLQDDNLCGLHAHYSPETKPAMCHLFPTSALATVFGVQVFDRAECHSYGKSAFDGTPYADRVEELKQPLTEVVRRGSLYHPAVNLDGYLWIDYGYFAPFEAYLDLVARAGPGKVEPLLAAFRSASFHLLGVLTRSDDAEHTPEQLVRSVVGMPPAMRYDPKIAPPIDRARGLRALRDWLAQMRANCEACRSQDSTLKWADLAIALRDIDVLLCHLGDDAQPAEVRRLTELVAGTPVAEEAQLDRRLVQLVRDLFFSKQYLLPGTYTNGIAWVAALVSIVAFGGRAQAASEGRKQAVGADLDAAQLRILRLSGMPGLARFPVRIAAAQAVLRDLALPELRIANPTG